jgi:hypothetical protein
LEPIFILYTLNKRIKNKIEYRLKISNVLHVGVAIVNKGQLTHVFDILTSTGHQPIRKTAPCQMGCQSQAVDPVVNGSDRPNGHGSAVRPRIDYSEGVRLSSELRDPGCYFNETHVLGGEKKNNFLVRCVWFSAFRSAPSHLPSMSVAWATTTASFELSAWIQERGVPGSSPR